MPRIIIVSNRLPITIDRKEGELFYHPSAGGLATGLNSLDESLDRIWVGWPGGTIESSKEQASIRRRLKVDGMMPVFLTEEDIELYYEGFSNKTIWPHFHYFPQYTDYNDENWEHYVKVNRTFADEVAGILKKGDIVWVHDYQLMLLPQMIREKFPDILIGFFLHIPFPSYELFRLLPWRKEILTGLLGSDLIGFHIFGYMRHFLSSVYRLLGHDHEFGRIVLPGRSVMVDVFPMGIDYEKFSKAPSFRKGYPEQWKLLKDLKVILSIDRLDYSKGIKQRLLAFDSFLEKYPEYREKVTLVLVVVPSRSGVPQYQELKQEIDTLVGRINGSYATFRWAPIFYFYRSFNFKELSSLYRLSDIALVTPLRDGMNLIAKEFVASKKKAGVLILSEMAGASKELGEALLINPNDMKSMVSALRTALEMPVEEQYRRLRAMQLKLSRMTVDIWANSFLEELKSCRRPDIGHITDALDDRIIDRKLVPAYRKASRRLIVLDYDGTLMPFQNDPEKVVPEREVLRLLKDLISDTRNKVVLSSGRDRHILEKWLKLEGLDISAEHGVWARKDGAWTMSEGVSRKWKDEVKSLLDHLVRRTPGSFIEEKEFALVWHYRSIDKELGLKRVREFKDVLSYIISNHNLQILEGNKILEIKNAGVNKGKALLKWLNERDWEFVMVIGDDITDEDMFSEVSPKDFSIKVGLPPSAANFSLEGVSEVRGLLKRLVR